jgi:hypothetical protein
MIAWLIWKRCGTPIWIHLQLIIKWTSSTPRIHWWNLKKGFIWHSKSLISVLIMFVKKKDGSFQMCVNYRGLNRLTIKN